MIIFINGAFGVGKTTVAELIVKALPNSLLFDPEEIGFFLRKVLEPVDKRDDFQHYPMWRTLTVTTAQLLKKNYGRDLVIPMTIWRPEYFDEVMTGLRQVDADLRHFCLVAPLEVVHKRLSERGEQKPGSWPYKQAELAVPSFELPLFAKHLPADTKTPKELVEIILATL